MTTIVKLQNNDNPTEFDIFLKRAVEAKKIIEQQGFKVLRQKLVEIGNVKYSMKEQKEKQKKIDNIFWKANSFR